eukprot:scaffold14175_cov37-Cyclotella_meneghiniana.AAC.1
MSRWLRNVNALLENLDTQVEETVDERFNDDTDYDDVNSKDGDDAMDDILAKRGLLLDDDDENDTSAAADDDVEKDDGEDMGEENYPVEAQQDEEEVDFESEAAAADEDRGESNDEKSTSAAAALQLSSDDANLQPSKVKEHVRKESMDDRDEKEDQVVMVPAQTQKLEVQPASAKSTNTVNTPPTTTNTSTTLQLKDKEIKKYRRTILQLNNTLTTAESEIEAQRSELERAASRIERDRSRFKSEKESIESSHKAEITALTANHERALNNYKRGMEEQLREMEGRIARAERARVQEGGERDAELSDALQRERTALEQVANINDEKNTLIERVSSLSSEVARLTTRLEHATSQLELASNRERNAEEQLDKALSLHARQLGVRQKRESELEQTVADLGAALVVAKSKVERKLEANSITGRAYGEEEEEGLQDKLEDAQDEIETLKAQLTLERQRIQTLHVELQDLSKEHSEELAGAHVRQRQYERQISDLTTAVGKLQSNLSSSKPGSGEEGLSNVESSSGLQYSGDETKETDHLRKQIASLSEKIFTQQSKLDRTSGEISTLKTRLQSAILRAETAENSLEGANQRLMMLEMMPSGGYATSGVSSADEEMATAAAGRRRKGPSSRRRVPMGDGTTTRRLHRSKVESIRSALGLHHGRIPSNTCQETTAVILDTCDTIAIDLGSHFRHYPLSRLAFMLYMVLLHAWAFFLLVYHAHAQGTGGLDHYSPESMMMSYRHVEQMPKVAALNQVPLPPSVDKVPILPPQSNQVPP